MFNVIIYSDDAIFNSVFVTRTEASEWIAKLMRVDRNSEIKKIVCNLSDGTQETWYSRS